MDRVWAQDWVAGRLTWVADDLARSNGSDYLWGRANGHWIDALGVAADAGLPVNKGARFEVAAAILRILTSLSWSTEVARAA